MLTAVRSVRSLRCDWVRFTRMRNDVDIDNLEYMDVTEAETKGVDGVFSGCITE